MKKIIYTILSMAVSALLAAQDSMPTPVFGPANAPAQTTWLNGHAHETLAPKTFRIGLQNRFGTTENGVDDFFGLDNASQRIFVEYGLIKRLQIGVGRSGANKTVDAHAKYQIWSENGKPIGLAFVSSAFLDTRPWAFPERENFFTSRLAYNFQAIATKNFGRWGVQLMPGVVHRNLISLNVESNDVINVGLGVQCRVSANTRFVAEYFYNLPDQLLSRYENPLSLGVHVRAGMNEFQFSLSNAQGLNERAVITETEGSWADNALRLGFTYARAFKLKKGK